MKILVVDDERDMELLFRQRFRKEIKGGQHIFFFSFSGEEAISFLNEHPKDADLILSDINMPGMNGFELLTEIRKKHKNPPPTVMMITAYGDHENRSRALELGANDFLTKPVDFELLKEKLEGVPGQN